MTFTIRKTIGAYPTVLVAWTSIGLLAPEASAAQPRDSVHAALKMKENCQNQPSMSCTAPFGVSDPEKWVFVGEKETPGKMLKWTWAKPSPDDPTQWTELFEYQNFPRGKWTAKKFLESLKKSLAKACSFAKVTVTLETSNELVLELNAVGCPVHDDDEIDRYLFGESDLFQFVYTVKGREMSPEQRSMGLSAVGNWGLNPPDK